MANNVVGERVRLARRINASQKLSQSELAAKLQLDNWHISRGGIAKIEAGVRRVTDVEVKKLAKVLGVSTSWLLGESDDHR